MNIIKKFFVFREEFNQREKYSTNTSLRTPFYDLAGKYLPKDKNAIVVDIGCGYGEFCKHLNLDKRYKNLFLLDGSMETVNKNKNIKYYRAPGKLFFDDKTVDYIHCSHMIEHLYPEDLFEFLKEVDRVLKDGGYFIVSTPLLWDRFYGNMSHIKPYYPAVFRNYLCRKNNIGGSADTTKGTISTSYSFEELVYRYRSISIDEFSYSSIYFIVDLFLKIWRRLLSKLGFRKYIKNGYTLVLKKN